MVFYDWESLPIKINQENGMGFGISIYLFVAHVKSWYSWQAQKFTCCEKRHRGQDCIVCSWYFLGFWMLTLHITTAVHDCFAFAVQYCSTQNDGPARENCFKTLYTPTCFCSCFFQWFSLSLHSNLHYYRLQTSLEDRERRHWPSQLSVVKFRVLDVLTWSVSQLHFKHLPIIPQ